MAPRSRVTIDSQLDPDIDVKLTDANFDFVRASLANRVAISLTDEKRYLIVNRLLPVLRRHRIPSLDLLVNRLRMASKDPLWDEIIDALTTNETSFFRDAAPFRVLSESILPMMFAKAETTKRNVSVWSAGCSSGQEAYSLAILTLEAHRNASERLTIVGSDASGSMLHRAAAGRFTPLEVSRGLNDARRRTFFQPWGDGWEATDPLKRLMRWQKFSLVDQWPTLPLFDLVLLRNVLVYFDQETRDRVLVRVRSTIRPGGVLLLGSAESMISSVESFQRVNRDGVTHYVAR